MKRFLTVFLVSGFLTAGMIADLSAQTTTTTTSEATSATRRSSLFGASRIDLFSSNGRENDRSELKGKSVQTTDPMMDLLQTNSPSETLRNKDLSNMDIFLTTGAIQARLNLSDTPETGETEGALIIGDIATDVGTGTATAAIRQSGLYAPRLRFLQDTEELSAAQTPEAMTKQEEANRILAEKILGEITDKFELPNQTDISLEFRDSIAHIQGRVPSPIQRKQIEVYLRFEPGVYFVQNDLKVDPSMASALETGLPRPTTHIDPAP